MTVGVVGGRPRHLPQSELRSGMGYWVASLVSMMRFDYGRVRQWVPMMIVIQTMMGAGMALLYGFFYPHVTATRALYITTGAPTLALIPLGFVMLPGTVAEQKLEGTFDYIWSLPSPRSAQAASTFVLYTLLALPGSVFALLVAAWRYDVHLVFSPLLVPAVVLCALMAITVGYGMALAISNPMVTNVVTNALMFVCSCSPRSSIRCHSCPAGSPRSTTSCPSTTWPSSSGPASLPASRLTWRPRSSSWWRGPPPVARRLHGSSAAAARDPPAQAPRRPKAKRLACRYRQHPSR